MGETTRDETPRKLRMTEADESYVEFNASDGRGDLMLRMRRAAWEDRGAPLGIEVNVL